MVWPRQASTLLGPHAAGVKNPLTKLFKAPRALITGRLGSAMMLLSITFIAQTALVG